MNMCVCVCAYALVLTLRNGCKRESPSYKRFRSFPENMYGYGKVLRCSERSKDWRQEGHLVIGKILTDPCMLGKVDVNRWWEITVQLNRREIILVLTLNATAMAWNFRQDSTWHHFFQNKKDGLATSCNGSLYLLGCTPLYVHTTKERKIT